MAPDAFEFNILYKVYREKKIVDKSGVSKYASIIRSYLVRAVKFMLKCFDIIIYYAVLTF